MTLRRYSTLALLFMPALAACPDAHQKLQAMARADLHLLSAALTQLRADGAAFPVTGPTLDSLDSALGRRLVEAGYVRDIPKEPWGGTFGYWSDGAHFMIVSPGPNQRFDLEYGQMAQEPVLNQPELLCGRM